MLSNHRPRASSNLALFGFLSLGVLSLQACTEGDKFFIAPRPDRPGNFSATEIDESNLAADGLALSPSGGEIDQLRQFVADQASELATPDLAADSTVIVMTAGTRLLVTHQDGGGVHPCVELQTPDRDESVPIDLSSAIALPLRLSRYTNSDGSPRASVNANDGAWVLIYTYQTLRSAGAIGPRRALAAHVFVLADKINAQRDDGRLGRLRYGWQLEGRAIASPFVRSNEDIVGLALLSDGLIGMASYSSSARAHGDTNVLPINGSPGPNSLRGGQELTRLGLLLFQMVQDDPATSSHEARLSLLFSGFDLERLRFESAFEIAPKAGHFEPDNTGIFRGATAFEPGRVLVSNQHAALILDDVKRMPGTLEVQSRESVATILTIVDDGLGRCRPRLDLDADLSLNGPTRGFHGSGLNERARLVESLGFLGPDEGLSDETVLFLLVNDGHGGNNDPDSDEQIYAAAINSARRGRLEGSLVNAPRRVSTHRDSPSTSVSDPVLDPRLSLMRDGRAALILYRQAESSGQGPGIALNGVLFKTSPASGFPGSRFSLEARLDGAPSDSSRSFVGSNGLELRAVSDMALPRGLSLRCAPQSDAQRVLLLYEQSGPDSDRVFARSLRLDVTTLPRLELESELELETSFPVSSDRGGSPPTFLEGQVRLQSFELVDLGAELSSSSPAPRDWLIVFEKDVDDNALDDGRGDIDIVAQQLRLLGTQLQYGFRVRVDDTDEGEGAARQERTSLSAVLVDTQPGLERLGPEPARVTIVFRQPRGSNITSPLGIYVRSFDSAQLRNAPNTPPPGLFRPALDAPAQALDSGSGDAQILSLAGSDRLRRSERLRGGAPAALLRGPRILIFFRQDDHIYAAEARDGATFSTELGAPTPFIIDNDSYGTPAQEVFIAPVDDGQCGGIEGTSIIYLKATSVAGAKRALLRRITAPRLF